MATLAFYCGTGNASDRLICWVTRSRFSHVELLPAGVHIGDEAQSWSASGRDGGVRTKPIRFDPAKWTFVHVPWARPDAIQRIEAELGKPYDFVGLLGSQLFNLNRHQQNRWFCSEICAHAIGLDTPQAYSPGGLMRVVTQINQLWGSGHRLAGEPPEE